MNSATRRFARRLAAAFVVGVVLIVLTAVASLLAVRALAPPGDGVTSRLELSIQAERQRHVVDVVAIGSIVAYALLALLLGRELVRRFDEAQGAISRREKFLASTAHELSRPLALLEQELARLRPLSSRVPEIERTLAGSDVALDRLHRLFAELEEATRLSSGAARLARESVDLSALARDVAVRIAREHPGMPLEVEAPARVVGEWDPKRLREVVFHLVSNAVKFGQGRRIRVRVVGGERARLVVQDHGTGISPAAQARLFDAYAGAGEMRGGLGLGLYIVRSIVAAHGGSVRVESLPGLGSKFTVELPFRPPEVTRERAPRLPFLRPQHV